MLFVLVAAAHATEPDAGDDDHDAIDARKFLFRQRFPGGLPHGREVADAADAWMTIPVLDPGDPGGWVNTGPAPLQTNVNLSPMPNAGPLAGRASAIAFDPDDASVVYAAFGLGGVWKSTDGGGSWTDIGDALPTQSVGALLVDPRDPDTVWVGTGEDALWLGEGGRGLFVSHDAGASFTHVGDDTWDGDAISKLVLDPATGDLYVGTAFGVHGWDGFCETSGADVADHGLFRSTDDGQTFTRLRGGDILDFVVDDSTAPPTLFADDYDSGLWRTLDDANTWTRPSGLPRYGINLHVAVASDPDVVYAGGGTAYNDSGLFVSLDHGATFAAVPNSPNYCYNQCDYQNAVTVDPDDPGTVYLGGGLCAVWKVEGASGPTPTVDGVSCNQSWWLGSVHPDTHDLVWAPDGALWAAEDGGLARSPDLGDTWQKRDEGVSSIQMYGLCVDPNDPVATYAGAQDNGPMRRTADGWEGLSTGDGGPCAVDAGDPNNVIVTDQYASVLHSNEAFNQGYPQWTFETQCDPSYGNGCGDRSGFVAPVANHPGVPGRFYVGTQRLWSSEDGGATFAPISDDLTAGQGSLQCFDASNGYPWDDVLSAIAGGPSDADTVYTGSEGGILSYTHDGGFSWDHVGRADNLPKRWVTSVAVDALNQDVAYAAFSAFDADTPTTPGHVFRTDDGGKDWTRLDIPVDVPVDSLLAHPDVPGVVYAGTDLGLLISTDYGDTWSIFGEGMPAVPIYALAFREVGPSLVAGTFGRGAWELPLAAGHLSVDPPEITIDTERKRGAEAVIEVRDTETSGNVIHFDATTDADFFQLRGSQGVAGGAVGSPIVVVVGPPGDKGALDATIVITGSNGDRVEVPVHVVVAGRPCGCETDGSPAGLLAVGVAGLVATRRRQRLSGPPLRMPAVG